MPQARGELRVKNHSYGLILKKVLNIQSFSDTKILTLFNFLQFKKINSNRQKI